MIVDLLRNDLGRVAETGSVVVDGFLSRGVAADGAPPGVDGRGAHAARTSPPSCLRATFPAGSITGAPKLRAMQIIDELEPVARACPTAARSAGSARADRWTWRSRFAPRSLDGERLRLRLGGGIVADSIPTTSWPRPRRRRRRGARRSQRGESMIGGASGIPGASGMPARRGCRPRRGSRALRDAARVGGRQPGVDVEARVASAPPMLVPLAPPIGPPVPVG